MKTNYVLIDFENVRPRDLCALPAEHFKVRVFVGANQHSVPVDLAAALQPFGDRAEYLKISGSGRNALDFHIAYYIGQLAAGEPEAFFHIISKDTGFDPLIEHLRERKIFVKRSNSIAEMQPVKVANATSPADRLEFLLANLRRRGAAKPASLKTLSSTVSAVFLKQLSEAEIAALVEQLQAKEFVSVDGTKVVYSSALDAT